MLRVAGSVGETLIVYSDPDRLEEHMLQLSPADHRPIRSLCSAIRTFKNSDLSVLNRTPRPLMTASEWGDLGLRMVPFLPAIAQWGLTSAGDFASRFRSPFLRRAVAQMFSWPETPMMAGLAMLAYMNQGNAGFPAGGSLQLVRDIEKRYLSLGGQIHYQAQVEKILVEDGKAVGVRLYNDENYHGDAVISAADGRSTLFYMLGKQYLPRRIRCLYNGDLPIHTLIQVSLGVRCDFSSEPHWTVHLLDQPLLIAGELHGEIGVKNYCFDPTLAPEGHSVLVSMIRTNYDYWQRIYGHRLYDSEQEQVAGIVINYLETLYPDLRGSIVVTDVATPLSYERYTGNWQGSNCGWLMTKQSIPLMMKGMEKTLPGVANFYLAGQWVEPGGSVPVAAVSGRNAVQLFCAADRKPFVSQEAG
jgi:phytoene dehydrogenase-like protein